jgi:hypothetical protein
MPKALSRRALQLELRPMPDHPLAGMRCPTAADESQLASLMYRAYQGTIDDQGEDEGAAGSVRLGRVPGQPGLPQLQIHIEFEEDLGAQLEVADHDVGLLLIEGSVQVGRDDHHRRKRVRR